MGTITFCLVALLWILIARVTVTGRELRRDRQIMGSHDSDLLRRKKRLLASSGVVLVAVLVLIVWQVLQEPKHFGAVNEGLHDFHRMVYALFTGVVCVTVVLFNGVRRPDVHARFAYTSMALLLILTLSGAWMYFAPT